MAIENGSCYHIHSFLRNAFLNKEQLKTIDINIFFDCGKMPSTKNEYNRVHDTLLLKNELLQKSDNQDGKLKICHSCGHSFDQHQLRGFPKKDSEVIDEGWILCPEKDCTCFRTWSINLNYP